MASLVETSPSRPALAGRSPFDSPVVLTVLVLVALVGLYDPRNVAAVLRELRLPDSDDVMRLVGVRDLLGGQGWFDNVQHRMLPPEGVASHWSRLIDLPIAGLVLAFTPLLGRGLAEGAAALLWPPLLFALYAVLAFRGVRRLFGWRAAVLVLFVAPQSGVVQNLFQFGRIDHHNAQLCAMLAMTLALADPDRRTSRATLAGLVAGLSLAIGLEAMALIAAAGLFLTFEWVIGQRSANRLAGFGAALSGSSLILFGLQTSPALWGFPACDALSPPWLLLAAGGAAAGAAATLAERLGFRRVGRLATVGGVGAVLAAGFMLVAPACLAGPFAGMDALVRNTWLYQVDEMRSFWAVLQRRPDAALANVAPLVVVALYATVAALREAVPERRRFFALIATLAWPGMLVTLAQVRGVYVVGGLVPLVAGIALDRAVLALRTEPSTVRKFATLGVAITMLGKAWAFAVDLPARVEGTGDLGAQSVIGANWRACTDPAALAALESLPPGLVLGMIDLGPALLLRTHHAVVAGPYHRDLAGLRASIEATEGSAEALRHAALEQRADYLVLCTAGLGETRADAPEPFANGLARNTQPAPDWLEPIGAMPADSALRAWRIKRP